MDVSGVWSKDDFQMSLPSTTITNLFTNPYQKLLEKAAEKNPDLRKQFESQVIELQKHKYSDVYKLKIIKNNLTKLLDVASTKTETCPFVISVIGETHVGKSSLIPALLGENVTYRSVVEKAMLERKAARREKDQGTTANACLHRSQNGLIPNYYVLDMEGTGAKDIPYYLEQIITLLGEGKFTETVTTTLDWVRSNPQARREAVENLLMVFAVLISDVVVYIDIHPFSNASYFDRMNKLVESIGQIDNLAPDLVLISNKCKMVDMIWDNKEQTARFLKETGRAEIDPNNSPMGFRSVTCINIPDWTEMGEVTWDDARNEYISIPLGAQNYVQKIKQLQELVSQQLYKVRREEKQKLNLLVSEKIWLILLQKTVEDFPNAKEIKQKKKIPSIWDKYITVVSDIDDRATKIKILTYMILDSMNKPHLSQQEISVKYHQWRIFSYHLLAGIIVCGIKGNLNGESEPCIPAVALQKHLSEFEALKSDMNQLAFCAAINNRVSEKGELLTVRCTKHLNHHQMNHQNPLPFFYAQTDEATIVKFFKWLSAFVGIGYPSYWTGNFLGSTLFEFDPEKERNQFLEFRQEFLKMEKQEYIIRELAMALNDLLVTNDIDIPRPYETLDNDSNGNNSNKTVVDLCAVCLEHSSSKCKIDKGLCGRCILVWNSIKKEDKKNV